MVARLVLTDKKLQTLASGLKQIAEDSVTAVGRVIKKTNISEGMELQQITVPIGVLMVIFESRPDALPQVSILPRSYYMTHVDSSSVLCRPVYPHRHMTQCGGMGGGGIALPNLGKRVVFFYLCTFSGKSTPLPPPPPFLTKESPFTHAQ